MSYYSNIEESNNKLTTNIIGTEDASKFKFIYNENPANNTPGYYKLDYTKKMAVDCENELITPGLNSKDKTQLKLKDNLSPYDFNLSYSNGIKKDSAKDIPTFYFNNRDIGAGRGFGNLSISNDIRLGDHSRKDTKEFKETKEGEILFDYQFQILDKNFQDPNHLVMPIPRGGEMTRRQNQLNVNNMRNNYNNQRYGFEQEMNLTKSEEERKIDFKY
jgi:hypothetical protein